MPMPFLLAAALATAPLDATHAAALRALQTAADATGCDPEQLRKGATDAQITRLGHLPSGDVVIAAVQQPCICGNANCPYYVLRVGRGEPRLLYSTYAIGFHTVAASPLPNIVFAEHDSVAVIDERVAAYRHGAYADISSSRVRADTGARKPDDIPVRFAPGRSSSTLRGRASAAWYDSYVFTARAGQQLTLKASPSNDTVNVTVFGPRLGGQLVPAKLGKPVTIPASGAYELLVEVDSSDDRPYVLSVTIR